MNKEKCIPVSKVVVIAAIVGKSVADAVLEEVKKIEAMVTVDTSPASPETMAMANTVARAIRKIAETAVRQTYETVRAATRTAKLVAK